MMPSPIGCLRPRQGSRGCPHPARRSPRAGRAARRASADV